MINRLNTSTWTAHSTRYVSIHIIIISHITNSSSCAVMWLSLKWQLTSSFCWSIFKIWLTISIYWMHKNFSVMYVNVEHVIIQPFVTLILRITSPLNLQVLWAYLTKCVAQLRWLRISLINDNRCLIKKSMFDALKLPQNTSQFTIGAIQNELRSIVSLILHAVSNQSHLLPKIRTRVTLAWDGAQLQLTKVLCAKCTETITAD